nr:MAG: hypothetical protein DIU57_17715 [Pseudomonadota bacterium]
MSDREMTVMTFNGKTFEVDDDIADLVHALNTAGIATVASCSGHGMRPGRISLADGRELFVLPSYEIGQWFDTQFPRDINGQTADERTELAKDAARYRWLRDPCSGAERVIFYCRGDYGRGLKSGSWLDAAIDEALAKENSND